MSALTRAALINLMLQKILSGNNSTTAQNVRDLDGSTFDSFLNIIDDLNTNSGYLGIDINGRVDVTKINSATPVGYYLRDDGTWQPVSSGPTSITRDLVTTNTISLSTYSGELIITLSNTGGGGAGTLKHFTNFTNVTKITIYTALDLTVEDALVSGGSTIKLYTGSLIIYGSKSGFIELVKRGSVFYQTNYIDQYNS